MTTPLEALDGIMPYGVNVSANASSTYILPDGSPTRVDGSFILLPEGPCQIQFSWPGKQEAYVRWVDSSLKEKGVPIEISGGGGIPQRPLSSAQPPATNCKSAPAPTPRREQPELSQSTRLHANQGGGQA